MKEETKEFRCSYCGRKLSYSRSWYSFWDFKMDLDFSYGSNNNFELTLIFYLFNSSFFD